MILSELKIDQSLRNTGKPTLMQKIDIMCDICNKTYNINYLYVLQGRKKYNKDLCRSCKQKEQYKQGKREVQKQKIALYALNIQKGKKIEELYGKEKAKQIKQKYSKRISGRNNPNYGGKYGFKKGESINKGKTLEEICGVERAKKIKEEYSKRSSGSKNNMYGKPSPQGSGNGWSGWYKGWFFRSLLELSYMINVIEKNGWKWESAESKKYKISYMVDDKERNYFCDFLIEDKTLTEIKPKNIRQSKQVLLKEEAAKKWCEEHNLLYKIVCDDEFNKLTFEEIKNLYNKGFIKFIDRYENKYKERYL